MLEYHARCTQRFTRRGLCGVPVGFGQGMREESVLMILSVPCRSVRRSVCLSVHVCFCAYVGMYVWWLLSWQVVVPVIVFVVGGFEYLKAWLGAMPGHGQ